VCVSGAAKPWAAKPWPTLARVSSTQRLAGEARAYETYQRSEGDELCERRGIGGGGGVVAAKLLGRRLRALQRHPRRSLSPRHMRAQFPPLRSTSAALPHTVVSAAVDPGDGQQGEVGTSLARVHSRGWTHTRGSLLRRRRVSGAGEPAREHHHRRGAKARHPVRDVRTPDPRKCRDRATLTCSMAVRPSPQLADVARPTRFRSRRRLRLAAGAQRPPEVRLMSMHTPSPSVSRVDVLVDTACVLACAPPIHMSLDAATPGDTSTVGSLPCA